MGPMMILGLFLLLGGVAAADPPMNPDWTRCGSTADCVILGAARCDQMASVNKPHLQAYLTRLHQNPKAQSCPPAVPLSHATCLKGHCTVIYEGGMGE